MNLLEQFNYLVECGVIKIEEENSHNLFEHNMLRGFKKELKAEENKDEEIEDLNSQIEDLQEEIDDLESKLDELRD